MTLEQVVMQDIVPNRSKRRDACTYSYGIKSERKRRR